MNFTSIFFENFFKIASLPFQTLGITGTSAALGGTSTFLTASDCLTDGIKQFSDDDGDTLLGSTSVISATATVATYMQTHDIDYPDVQMTKAYIESLDKEQLNELIANLDEVHVKIENTEEEQILARKI